MKIELVKETGLLGKVWLHVRIDGVDAPNGIFLEHEEKEARELYQALCISANKAPVFETLESFIVPTPKFI